MRGIAQAIEANNYIESNFQPVTLPERLPAPASIDLNVNSVAIWLKLYPVIKQPGVS